MHLGCIRGASGSLFVRPVLDAFGTSLGSLWVHLGCVQDAFGVRLSKSVLSVLNSRYTWSCRESGSGCGLVGMNQRLVRFCINLRVESI